MIGHFIRYYTVGTADQADNNLSSVVGKMLTPVTAGHPVTDGVLKLLFKELINQKAAKKAYKMKQKAVPQTTTPVITTPIVTAPNVTIAKTNVSMLATTTVQNAKPADQNKNTAAKTQKTKTTAVTGVKM